MLQDTIILYSGIEIPVSIRTDERIFQIETFENETILCNTAVAKELISKQVCKKAKHYWNYKFSTIGKDEILEMSL
jgi:hypothetical protein